MGPLQGPAKEPDMTGLPKAISNLVNDNKDWSNGEKVKNALTQPGVLKAFNAWKQTHKYELTFDAFKNIDLAARKIQQQKSPE